MMVRSREASAKNQPTKSWTDTMGCCSSYAAGGAHTLHNILPGTELVKSPTRMVDGQMTFLKMDGDLFLDGVLLDATWFYNKALNPAAMQASLTKLLTLYPCLAARRSTTGLDMCNAGVAFSVQTLPGSARDHLNSEPRHGIFADVRDWKKVKQGMEPIMTVRISNFEDGTSALGVCITHALVDGFSFNKIMQIWSEGHMRGFPDAPVYTFDRKMIFDVLPKVDVDETRSSGAKVRKLTAGISSWWPWIVAHMVDKQRARIHLSFDEIAQLKKSVVTREGSAVTTGEALMARLLKHLSDLMHPRLSQDTTLVMVANLRGRGGLPTTYLGNLATFVSNKGLSPLPACPKDMDDTALVDATRQVGNRLRGQEAAAKVASDQLKTLSLMEQGYLSATPHGPPEGAKNVFNFNNQVSFPQAQIRFGEGSIIGYVPWCIDMVQVVPSMEPDLGDVKTSGPLVRQGSTLRNLVGASESVRDVFNSCDADKSGTLSKSEVAVALKQMHVTVDDSEVDSMVATYDLNQDGVLDLAEFETAFKTARLSGGIDVYIKTSPFGGTSDKIKKELESDSFKAKLIKEPSMRD